MHLVDCDINDPAYDEYRYGIAILEVENRLGTLAKNINPVYKEYFHPTNIWGWLGAKAILVTDQLIGSVKAHIVLLHGELPPGFNYPKVKVLEDYRARNAPITLHEFALLTHMGARIKRKQLHPDIDEKKPLRPQAIKLKLDLNDPNVQIFMLTIKDHHLLLSAIGGTDTDILSVTRLGPIVSHQLLYVQSEHPLDLAAYNAVKGRPAFILGVPLPKPNYHVDNAIQTRKQTMLKNNGVFLSLKIHTSKIGFDDLTP